MKKTAQILSDKYGKNIEWHHEVTSTNDITRDKTYKHGDVVIADNQTKGRGQRGNSWNAAKGENLTFSMIVEPIFLPAEKQFILSEAVSLSLTDTLAYYEIESSVKWPNDIYAGDKKIVGILIENDISMANLSRSIIGIGLNVNQRLFADNLPNPVSMSLITGKVYDRPEVFEVFYTSFAKRYNALSKGLSDDIHRDYFSKLYRRNKPHTYRTESDGYFTGIIRNVSQTGELTVEHPDGSLKNYLFKEIESLVENNQ